MYDGHQQPILELLSNMRSFNKQRHRIQTKFLLLSASPPLADDGGFPLPSQLVGSSPSQLSKGLSCASPSSKTDGNDSTDTPGLAVPPDALTTADVAGGVDTAKPPGVLVLLCTGEPEISFVAALLNEVTVVVPRPSADAAFPHGTVDGVGATRCAATLDTHHNPHIYPLSLV